MSMVVDDDEDVVTSTLREAKEARDKQKQTQTLMPPPAQARRGKSPTEEPEEVEEPKKKPTKGKKVAADAHAPEMSSTPITKDEAFLQAISKAKGKKAIDQFDKEFNQLRLAKPGTKAGTNVVKANVWDATHPDYGIVSEFDDDMTGNFITIVKRDLFRKDLGQKRVEVLDDGKPNFKKFKKVRVEDGDIWLKPRKTSSEGIRWSCVWLCGKMGMRRWGKVSH
jgi:hypothetical protein